MKTTLYYLAVSSLIASSSFAQDFDEHGLPVGFKDQAQESLTSKSDQEADKLLLPTDPEPLEASQEEIKTALDLIPAGDYIGELPDDLYLQLAQGNEAEHALKLLRKWEAEGENPLLNFNGSLEYTHGSGSTIILAKPTDLVDIELQEGEEVNDILIGDSVRWIITPTAQGSKNGLSQTTHIIVKAKKPNLTTRLIITTNRRTYRLRLVSSSVFNMPYVAFSYPQSTQRNAFKSYLSDIKKIETMRKKVVDDVQEKQAKQIEDLKAELAAKIAEHKAQDKKEKYAAKRLADPLKLDFFYRVKRKKGSPRWTPSQVYNDGQKTYIVMPKTMATDEAPILLVSEGKKKELVNYRLVDNKFVVDKIFNTAVLVTGVGRSRKEVEIYRTAK